MAVKAKGQITLSSVVDVSATYRYYLLQSSTLTKPTKPTTYPPSSSWDDTEPTYTAGSTNSLYTVDCTVFSDGTFAYSAVSLSSSYEAAKAAYNKANAAQNSVTSLTTRVTNAETAITNTNTQLAAKASKTEVTQAINNVTIGGRNFLLNSKDEQTSGAQFLRTTFDLAPIFEEHGLVEYTLSFDLKSDNVSNSNKVVVYCQNGSTARYNFYEGNVFATTEWQRISVTTTPSIKNSNVDESYLAFYGSGAGSIPHVRNVKLEKGNKATDWTPAPEESALKDEITNAVDNLQIGGTNLVPVSKIEAARNVETTQSFEITNVWGHTFIQNSSLVSILEPATTYTIGYELELIKRTTLPTNKSTTAGFLLYSSSTNIPLSEFFPVDAEVGTTIVVKKTFTTPSQWNGESILCYSRRWSSSDGTTYGYDDVFRVTNFKIERGNKATGWSPAPEDIEADIAETSNILHTEIVESTTNAILEADRMLVTALQSYVKTDDYGAFREEVLAELKLLADSLTLSFSTAQAATNAVNEDLQAKFNEITTYFTFDINGLIIGKVDNPYKMVLSNERYSMTVNGEEVMYIDAVTKMAYFPKLTITDAFVMLGYKFEHGGVEGLVNVDWIGGV